MFTAIAKWRRKRPRRGGDGPPAENMPNVRLRDRIHGVHRRADRPGWGEGSRRLLERPSYPNTGSVSV